MLKYFFVFCLALPLCGHGQSYADSPFYRPVFGIPSSAHVEYMRHGDIKANGIVIDLSAWESVPNWSLYGDGGAQLAADVDRNGPARVFHFYIQYNNSNVTFAYNLLALPEGKDKIKCTFSAFTDTLYDTRRKDIPVLALPADLTPLVIKSGDVIAIRTHPLADGEAEVIHYLRLTRIDLTPASEPGQ
jgi:hypothetical protein